MNYITAIAMMVTLAAIIILVTLPLMVVFFRRPGNNNQNAAAIAAAALIAAAAANNQAGGQLPGGNGNAGNQQAAPANRKAWWYWATVVTGSLRGTILLGLVGWGFYTLVTATNATGHNPIVVWLNDNWTTALVSIVMGGVLLAGGWQHWNAKTKEVAKYAFYAFIFLICLYGVAIALTGDKQYTDGAIAAGQAWVRSQIQTLLDSNPETNPTWGSWTLVILICGLGYGCAYMKLIRATTLIVIALITIPLLTFLAWTTMPEDYRTAVRETVSSVEMPNVTLPVISLPGGEDHVVNLNRVNEDTVVLKTGDTIRIIIRDAVQDMCYTMSYEVENTWKTTNGVVADTTEILSRERLSMMQRQVALTSRFEADFGEEGVPVVIRHHQRPC